MMLRGYTPNGYRLWESPEEAILRGNHPNYAAALALNTRRTRSAHYGKAQRMGITTPRGQQWGANEILRLHRLFPLASKDELLEALPARTWRAICTRANKDGYHRPRQPLPPTGCALLDQILDRARRTNWSLYDLDRELRGRGYFHRRRWRHGRYNFALHDRAVALLGGHVRVRWES